MMRKCLRSAAGAAVTAVAVLGLCGSAVAAVPTGEYADFKYCPYQNPAVTSCVYSVTDSGVFQLGNSSVPITAATPIILQGGFIDSESGATQWVNADGADTLSKTRLKVPGGLVGLIDQGGLTGLLISALNAAIAAENDVYATAELVGPVQFNLTNALQETGTGVALPVRVHLENPFLGSSCYIGSAANPVSLNLTTGTTSPPAPNTPISGSRGDTVLNDALTIINAVGIKLVDNSFAAPAATNCGITFLDRLLVTPAVNLKQGLPAAAGKNTAIQQGNTKIGGAAAVVESVQ
jgi:hypothetical protein